MTADWCPIYVLLLLAFFGCARKQQDVCVECVLPKGQWTLFVTNQQDKPLEAKAVFLGAETSLIFDEFKQASMVLADPNGCIVLTRSRSTGMPGPLAPSQWQVRISAAGYMDRVLNATAILNERSGATIRVAMIPLDAVTSTAGGSPSGGW